jgi:hypothetical protein
MGFLVFLLVLVAVLVASGFFAWRWIKAERAERSRNQVRLRVIEGQMALLRAMLRIGQAEYVTRQRMQSELHQRDVFANSTIHEEPEEWR